MGTKIDTRRQTSAYFNFTGHRRLLINQEKGDLVQETHRRHIQYIPSCCRKILQTLNSVLRWRRSRTCRGILLQTGHQELAIYMHKTTHSVCRVKQRHVTLHGHLDLHSTAHAHKETKYGPANTTHLNNSYIKQVSECSFPSQSCQVQLTERFFLRG